MNLQEILEHRRAVRYYDASKPIDAERVEACVRLATLAPTSSNMQLWEAYHVTDRAMIDRLVPACMDQAAVKTAQQLVVFVVRPDLWKDHAEKVLSGGEHPQDVPAREVGKVCRSATSVLSKNLSFPLFARLRRMGALS